MNKLRPLALLVAVFAAATLIFDGPAALAQKDDAKKPKPKFTISKETTYVTGPIDKDGYIDYGAALNEKLRHGVTPQTNAAVLLWQAMGPHPEGATMPPQFFIWLAMAPPPEHGDYYLDLYRYVDDHLKLDAKEKQLVLDHYDLAGSRPWTARQYPHIASWLKRNEKPLAVVIEGTKRPRYFSPLVPASSEKGPSPLLLSLLPGVQKCREFTHALTSRAMHHLGEGRHEQAWQDLLACHRLGRLVAGGGTLIDGLVGIAIDAIASHADITFLDRAKLDAKTARACLRDLERLPPMPSMADKIDLTERFVFLDVIMMLERHGIDYVEALLGGAARPDPETRKLLENLDWDPGLRNINRWYDRLAAATRLKDRPERQKQLEQIDKELRELKAKLDDPGEYAKLLKAAKKSPGAAGKHIGDMLIAMLLPALNKVQHASDRTEQSQRNLRVAFALATYRHEHGAYPMKLDALAPKYLAEVPIDLFSGKPLIYRPTKTSYLVYSVGLNGKDDGGRWYDDDPPGDDPHVRMPLPKLKKEE